jgi:transposase
MLRGMISYKTNLIKVNPAYTSQDCHICGGRNKLLTLSDREWTCPTCGTHLDRDINAAKNILRKGIELSQNLSKVNLVGAEATEIKNACGGPRSSLKQESFTTSAGQCPAVSVRECPRSLV